MSSFSKNTTFVHQGIYVLLAKYSSHPDAIQYQNWCSSSTKLLANIMIPYKRVIMPNSRKVMGDFVMTDREPIKAMMTDEAVIIMP